VNSSYEVSLFLCLPVELQAVVMSYLGGVDLHNVSRTCRQIYQLRHEILLEPSLWAYSRLPRWNLYLEGLGKYCLHFPSKLTLVGYDSEVLKILGVNVPNCRGGDPVVLASKLLSLKLQYGYSLEECSLENLLLATSLRNLEIDFHRTGYRTIGLSSGISEKQQAKYPIPEWTSVVAQLTTLRELKLSSDLNVPTLEALEPLSMLQNLTLDNFWFLTTLQHLSPLNEIKFLKLGNLGTLATLAGLENLKRMERLELANCGKVTSLEPLRELVRLRELRLTRTSVRDVTILQNCGLTSLIYTGIETDEVACTISSLTSLTSLNLHAGEFKSLNFVAKLGKLKRIHLDHCGKLKDLRPLQQIDLEYISHFGIFDMVSEYGTIFANPDIEVRMHTSTAKYLRNNGVEIRCRLKSVIFGCQE